MASAKPSILTFLGLCRLVDFIPPDVASSVGQVNSRWLGIKRQTLKQRRFLIRSSSRLNYLIILERNMSFYFSSQWISHLSVQPFSHLAWVQTDRKSGGLGDLKYPLISDITKTISKAYDVLIADQITNLSRNCIEGLFIIDKEGIIQHSTINNLAVGRSVDETLRTLQALQYVRENRDEVCPAGWKPGDRSMKLDPKLSKEYFAAI